VGLSNLTPLSKFPPNLAHLMCSETEPQDTDDVLASGTPTALPQLKGDEAPLTLKVCLTALFYWISGVLCGNIVYNSPPRRIGTCLVSATGTGRVPEQPQAEDACSFVCARVTFTCQRVRS